MSCRESLPGQPAAIKAEGIGRKFTRTGQLARALAFGRSRSPRPEAPMTSIVALEDVFLEVSSGEIFGLLGPNGAGKTTLIKILSTLLLPTSGRAWVQGIDVATDPVAVRERIGLVSGGEVSGYGILTVRENLWLFSQLFGLPKDESRRRSDELLQAFGLWEYRDTRMSRLSTGFRQRLNVARGFVSDPDVLFLDEPTLGLDVEVARQVRAFVRGWVRGRPGRTVLLTTHYMLEADEMCDRVAVIDRGRIVACDRPAALKRLIDRDVSLKVRARPAGGTDDAALRASLSELPAVRRVSVEARPSDGTLDVHLLLDGDAGVGDVLCALDRTGARVLELHKPEPTLEDVFLKLVGRRLQDE